MNPRFKGVGKALFAVPILTFVPVWLVLRTWLQIDARSAAAAGLASTGFVVAVMAWTLDRSAGLNPISNYVWTRGVLRSDHLFLHLPIRVIGAGLLLASGALVLWRLAGF